MDPTLQSVRAFLAIVDEGHLGAAAQKLYVSAPALSQQLRRLEERVGARLLDRATHPVRPTPAGSAFLPHARELVRTLDLAKAAVSAVSRRENSRLTVGFINSVAGSAGRELLGELADVLGTGAVELVHLDWRHQTMSVRSGEVDAAFVRPPNVDDAGVRFDPVITEPRVAVLPSGHRLDGRSSIGIDELDGEVQVDSAGVDPSWLRWWSVDPRPSGVPVQYGPSVRTMDEVLEVVAAGRAIAITAACIAELYPRPSVCFVRIHDVEPCAVDLCTRSDDPSEAVQVLRQVVGHFHDRNTSARHGPLPRLGAG